jgi:hypothetical protein
MLDDNPAPAGECQYNLARSKNPDAPAKTDQLIWQIFQLIDGVADALEIEWGRINSAENLAWGDRLFLMEAGVRQFQRRQPSFTQIFDAMGIVAALKSQGRHCPPEALEQAQNDPSELRARLEKRRCEIA